MAQLSSPQQRIKRANPARPCPICGKTGCGQCGTLTLCWRVESPRIAKSGAFIHGDGTPYRFQLVSRIAPLIADLDHRHAVFSALLDRLSLADAHREHLHTVRGLTDETIESSTLRTVPSVTEADAITAALADQFDLAHVPGFWHDADKWRLRFAGKPGFFIPLRDTLGRIQALQIRLLNNHPTLRYLLVSTSPDEFPQGASSGAPTHFTGCGESDRLVIVEGGLKAIICAQLMRCRVAGLVGAGTFGRNFGWQLRTSLPGLRAVAIALDAPESEKSDRARENVAGHLTRLRASLTDAGFPVSELRWPAAKGKGLDDFLLQQQREQQQVQEGRA